MAADLIAEFIRFRRSVVVKNILFGVESVGVVMVRRVEGDVVGEWKGVN